MSNEIIGLLGLLFMLFLMAIRVPVALAMLVVGVGGFSFITNFSSGVQMLQNIPEEVLANYDYSAIPLFILMGVLAERSGMAGKLFSATRTIFGGFKGGIGLATIGSCGIFASISGSSLATASTMTKVALPEMEKYGYQRGMSCGLIAAGGTLGIMIPPSIALLLYAILTEQSVGDMFLAGLIPGLLGMLLYSITLIFIVKLNPNLVSRGKSTSLSEKLKSLLGLLPFTFIFILMMCGIFFGFFTPTEGAGFGAFSTWIYALFKGLGPKDWYVTLTETLSLSAVIFLMLMGAEALGYFISVSRLSFSISDWIANLDMPVYIILLCIILMYFILGMFMDAIAMLVITVPVVYPIIQSLGIDPIYFGIITVLTVELGLITPPVGMNIFVIKAMAPDIPLNEMFKGVAPFIISDFIRLALLITFPILSLGLL